MNDLVDQAKLASPWDEVRAQHPTSILVRVIAPRAKLQFFIAIPRTPRNVENGAEVHDGATVISGTAYDDAIVAAADEAWRAPNKARDGRNPS